MNVYVIMQGEYSDIHVVTVTLDKEKAEKLAKYHSAQGATWVDVFETDDTPDETLDNLIPVYDVTIGKDGRSTVRICTYRPGNQPYESKFYLSDDCMCFSAYLTAKDEAHALKIARDKRAKMLAEQFGL